MPKVRLSSRAASAENISASRHWSFTDTINMPLLVLPSENDATNYDAQSVGRYKIVVIGDDSCGKTSFLNAFVKRSYQDGSPWLFEDGVSTFRLGPRQVDFVIWDLSGLQHYDGLRVQFYEDTDLFLVCFDVGSIESFENVKHMWLPELFREEPETPFIIVGCKCDLRSQSTTNHLLVPSNELDNDNAVSKYRAEHLALEWSARDYVETCAKKNSNVAEVFQSAAQLLLQDNSKSNYAGIKRSLFGRRKSALSASTALLSSRFAQLNSSMRRGSSLT